EAKVTMTCEAIRWRGATGEGSPRPVPAAPGRDSLLWLRVFSVDHPVFDGLDVAEGEVWAVTFFTALHTARLQPAGTYCVLRDFAAQASVDLNRVEHSLD